jgi:hypothetical protein
MIFSNETKVKDIALANQRRGKFWRMPEWIIAAGGKSLHDACAHASIRRRDSEAAAREAANW